YGRSGSKGQLIYAGLLEEVRVHGSLLAWRRDAEAGPMALRVTKQGLEAIGVKDEWWPLPRKQAFVRLLPLRSKRLQPRTSRTGTAGGSVGATAWSGAGAAVTLRTSRTQKGRTTRRAECS